MATIKVFLTNLGKYNEGELVGEWVNLPFKEGEEREMLFDVLERIGCGTGYEEYFITDYECEWDGVEVGEFDSVMKLNELARALEVFDGEIISALIGDGYTLDEALDIVDDCQLLNI